MNIAVEKQPKCLATLRVAIPADIVKAKRSEIISGYQKHAKIQGFRPGKAPQSIVEKRYGKEISEEMEQSLISKAFDEALRQEKLKVIDFGKTEELVQHDDGSMSFESTLTLIPEFDLPEYKGLKLKSSSEEPTEEEITKQKANIQKAFATFTLITERAAQANDVVDLTHIVTAEGLSADTAEDPREKQFLSENTLRLPLNEDEFKVLPGFVAQIIGLKAGDKKSFQYTLPSDFFIDHLAGKEVTFEVSINSIQEPQIPEWNDDLAQKIGQFPSVQDLETRLLENVRAERKAKIQEQLTEQIVEHLAKHMTADLPEKTLEALAQGQMQTIFQEKMRSGEPIEKITASFSEIEAEAKEIAGTGLRANFVLQEIAFAEQLQVADQELVALFQRMAQQQNKNVKKVIEEERKRGSIESHRSQLLIQKAIRFVVDNADVEVDTNLTLD